MHCNHSEGIVVEVVIPRVDLDLDGEPVLSKARSIVQGAQVVAVKDLSGGRAGLGDSELGVFVRVLGPSL